MANGRAGRPPKPAVHGERATLTLRLHAEVKNTAIEMAERYGLTVAEYFETLVESDRART